MREYEIKNPPNINNIFVFKILDNNYPVGYAKLSNKNGNILLADIYIYDHTQADSKLSHFLKNSKEKRTIEEKESALIF